MPVSLAPVLADLGTVYAVQAAATTAVDILDVNSGVLYKVEIDNTAGTSAVYLKGYDIAGGGTVTPGVSHPAWVFKCPKGVKRVYSSAQGSAYAAGLKVSCSTGAGTAGTTSPSWVVSYGILIG